MSILTSAGKVRENPPASDPDHSTLFVLAARLLLRLAMLSEKQFCERAKSELRHTGDQVLALATDRDVYWKVEREVIQNNPQLCEARSELLDMLRGCYVDAMVGRLVRLLDGEDDGVSLPRVLTQLADYPELLHDRITQSEFADDRAALERAAARLKSFSASHVGRHERTLPALASAHRELDAALTVIIAVVETYYWIVTDGYIDLDVEYAEDPLSIFQFAWAAPVLAR
jgi:hypothetical protein